MHKLFKILSLWIPLAGYLGLIYYFSSLSRLNFKLPTADFPLHIIEYFILSILILRAINSGIRKKAGLTVILLSFAFAIAYAILDEIHQSYVPNRTPSVLDLAADTIGAFLGLMAISVFQRGVLKKGMSKR